MTNDRVCRPLKKQNNGADQSISSDHKSDRPLNVSIDHLPALLTFNKECLIGMTLFSQSCHAARVVCRSENTPTKFRPRSSGRSRNASGWNSYGISHGAH